MREYDKDFVEYVASNLDKANAAIVKPVLEQIDEVISATETDLERFVRAGGHIDFETWSNLNEHSKETLVGARHEWRVETVYMIAKAIQDHYGPEKIWGMLDGGEAFKDKVAEDITDDAAEKAVAAISDESIPSSPTDAVQAEARHLGGDE